MSPQSAPPPLYQRKAEFFRLLGHPVRIRALELLSIGPTSVRALLDDIGVESARERTFAHRELPKYANGVDAHGIVRVHAGDVAGRGRRPGEGVG